MTRSPSPKIPLEPRGHAAARPPASGRTGLSGALALAAASALLAPASALAAARPAPEGREAALAPAQLLPRPYPERLRWWAEARFGIFIHWGPVSLKGTEISWSRANTNPKCPNQGPIPAEVYDSLYKDFNPVKFDAAKWVELFRRAGAGYFVLTAKHCDGFLLWRSEVDPYNISRTPFGRDVCGELAEAARKRGIRVGWYFSPMDWRDPDFRSERHAAFLGRMHGELRELLGRYGRIDLLWFDWDGGEPLYEQERTYALVKELQPEIVINNRLDLAFGRSDREIFSPHGDYYTPEQEVGAYDDQHPWESCMTTSRSGQWAWGGPGDGAKTLEACLEMLIRCAGSDGNLLLNVGPMPTGEIPPEQAEVLEGMGRWLSACGESIYGTRGGPFKPGDYGASTRKGKAIFLHILDWEDDVLRLPPIPAKVLGSRVLTGGEAEVRQTAAGLEVSLPPRDRRPFDLIVALELDRPTLEIPAVDVPGGTSLARNAKATTSNVYQDLPAYGADKAVDGNPQTRWATDAGVTSAWLELDLGKEATFRR
ncbi:MAG: alpha-L-fucosidase, partial [Planctomycetota bacterium]